MVQALCRPNGAGPYSRSGSTKAKLAVPSLYPATSVTFRSAPLRVYYPELEGPKRTLKSGSRSSPQMGPGPPGSVIATKSDNQSKIAQQRKRIRPGTTARGVTIFHFFQKYNSRRPCDTVTSNAHIDS